MKLLYSMASNYRKLEPRTYEEQLIHEATLSNRTYSYDKIEPSVFFWKQLACCPPSSSFSSASSVYQTPKCLVPDTLIINQKQSQLMWIYTDQSGHVRRQTNINYKDFIHKLTSYSSPNELVAILKRPIFHEKLSYCNDHKLLNSRYLLNSSLQQLGQKQHIMCLQRFIKSSGPKAFLCRTRYNVNSSSECYLITNARNFYDGGYGGEGREGEGEARKFVVRAGDRAVVVRSRQGNNLEETVKYLKEIVRYMVFFRGIRLEEIVGDFIKDEMGNWWLINIKAFKPVQPLKRPPKSKTLLPQTTSSGQPQKQRYQKTKLCRYCERSYLESQLTYKMTMRMIVQVDKYLLHLGKEYNWLKRSNVSDIDSHFLYQEHKVCERCFRLYTEIQQLMDVEQKLLAKQGNQLIAHPKSLIFTQTNESHLQLQAKQKEIHRLQTGIPQIVELGPNTNITTTNNTPLRNNQIINKMVRFRFIIFLHEIDQVGPEGIEGYGDGWGLFLEFAIFGRRARYRLNTGLVARERVIPLNKLKVFYFFANSIDHLEQQYLMSNGAFKIYINMEHKETQEKRNIGFLELPFKDLMIPINRKKDFYKFFHVDNVSYGWGLQGSIGVIPSQGEVTTAKISFQKTQGKVYIPNQNYYFCEHLTQQWIDLIKTKTEKASNRRKMMGMSRFSKTMGQHERQRELRSLDRQGRKSHLQMSVLMSEKNQLAVSSAKMPFGELANCTKMIGNGKQNEHEDKDNEKNTNQPENQWKFILEKQIKKYEENDRKVRKSKLHSKPKLLYLA